MKFSYLALILASSLGADGLAVTPRKRDPAPTRLSPVMSLRPSQFHTCVQLIS
ncbi:hypothetical protein B0H13DRAFT_2365122 [Mycena leptocephala]|nr:hypothetical protein B0H13DRAFT_2365122 [Mycena leptocephala]